MGGGLKERVDRGRATGTPSALRAGPLEITEAKLVRPPSRPGLVHRTALAERLTASAAPLITIISPAGYGKTTLLAEWAERDERPFAWVSVDERDSDPAVFVSHVVAALDRVEHLGADVFEAIASPGASHPGRAVRRLGAALTTRTHPFVLALDDLDRSHERLSLDTVVTLVRHLPPGSAIAIAARTVPEVGMSRFRADGLLLEIDVRDLALNSAQARQLLRGVGFRATHEEAIELTNATEGWPVGLYLAGLARQERRSRVNPIRFTGEDRFIVDYMRSEVLGGLSRERQRFLTRSSILERLNGPLCDAVLERKGSARTLESIERENLLLIPLDRKREWYRYHALFRDALGSELRRREPAIVSRLHGRAADWFEALGGLDEAMRHAYAAGDLVRAGELLQRQMLSTYRLGRVWSIRLWLDRLAEAAELDPGLAVAGAWVAAFTGDGRAADRWLDIAERARPSGPSLMGTASQRSSLAFVRTIMMRNGHDAMLHEAEVAVREEPETSPYRPAALSFLGLAALLGGNAERADATFSESVNLGEPMGAFPALAVSLAERSLIAAARGDPEQAGILAERALDAVRTGNLLEYSIAGPAYAASARAALRAGDQAGAREHLTAAHRLRPVLTYSFPSVAVQMRLEAARVHVGLSDGAGARTLLAEIEEILSHRPDVGVLGHEAFELRDHVGSIRARRSPGSSALTAAELRVLNMLPTYLSFREIGARLFVSPNTVKSQAISIYRKLNVSSRSAAVDSARRLGLLEP